MFLYLYTCLNYSNLGVIGDVCYGDWRWPTKCRDCDYRVSWNYLDDTDEIEFSVETRAPSNWWTGIGFSPTGTMVIFFYSRILQYFLNEILSSLINFLSILN